ncbi:MAG: glycosyltransferase family A protein [Chitinophagaceae bacterium]
MNERNEPPPEISVIVPCYNYGHFLADALESLLAQDFEDWECLIIDDGSKDNSKEVALAFQERDSRIRYIFQENAGLSAARNKGLENSRGQYIQLLDADDGIASNKLQIQYQFLQENPEIPLVFGDAILFSRSLVEAKNARSTFSSPTKDFKVSANGKQLLKMLVRDNFLEVSCPLFRKNFATKIGLFDTSLKSYEDWQYWFRAALQDVCFHYFPITGSETFIRKGHASMMQQLRQMNAAGLQIRHFMQGNLNGRLAWYNRLRIIRLLIKRSILKLAGKI